MNAQNAGDLDSELRWISESGSQSRMVFPAAVRVRGKWMGWASLGCFSEHERFGNASGSDVYRNDKRWLMAMPVGEPSASPLI